MSKKEKFFTERDKVLLKIFLLIFLFFVIIINWKEVSAFFNLRIASHTLQNKFQELILSPEKDVVEHDDEMREYEEREEDVERCEGGDRIEVSAIEIEAPIVETEGVSEKEYREALDRGVVRFPDGYFPGEKGLTVLFGHSAPPGWPDINYDRVFTEIDKLQEGDEIEICYDNRFYTYRVIEEKEEEKVYEVGEDVPPLYPQAEKKELVLMTCWPPGDAESRMGVRAIID